MKVVTAAQLPPASTPDGVDVRHLHVTKDVVVSQITLQPGEALKPHKVTVDAFFYVLEGTPLMEIEGEEFVTGRDALIPSRAGQLHSIRNESDAVVRFLVVKTPNPKL